MVIQKKYSWKRFWCPRTAEINLGDSGFLYDPESEYGGILNPNVVPFSSFRETQFLGLLGEPGIGKSFALQKEVVAAKIHVQEHGGDVLYLNLGAIGSEDRLERKLFLSPEFERWKEQKRTLYIFLDSLDECLLSMPKLSNLLADELKQLAPDNLYIRIACRTINWPLSLEKTAKFVYPENEVKVFELVPLRRSDVLSAIQENNINPDQFMDEVSSRDVVPFAIKPLTLKLIINLFIKNGGLPNNRFELYRQALLALCEEQNQERRDSGLRGALNAEQRLSIASRIAALTIFCGKNSIWIGPNQGEISENDLRLSEIVGGNNAASSSTFSINEEAILETLGTGLFSSRGPNRMGWSHQTYAEFLAAKYVFTHQMEVRQMISLFCNPVGRDNKIIPQLVSTASWGASISSDFFRTLIELDPEVLLYCDFSSVSEDDRERLLDSLLSLYDKGDIFDSDWSIKEKYSQLKHPRIEDQLKPYISDVGKGVVVRRVAIDIAEECSLIGLQGDLLKIALDKYENIIIRKKAIRSIRQIADEEEIRNLRPLLSSDFSQDYEDELKAEILKTLWPNHVSLQEVLGVLEPPKKDNFIGSYNLFLREGFALGIEAGDVEKVLGWIVNNTEEWKRVYILKKFVKSVFERIISFIDDDKCLEAVTHTYLGLIKKHIFVFDEDDKSITDDHVRRFRLGVEFLKVISDEDKYNDYIYYLRGNLFYTSDVSELLKLFSRDFSQPFKKNLARLIRYLFVYEQFDLVVMECQNEPILQEEFKDLLQPIMLDSPEAEEIKKRHYSNTSRKEILEPLPLVRILECLDAIEEGRFDLWTSLLLNMTLEEDSTVYNWPDKDVRELPGWKIADPDTRSRIINAAKSYLINGSPEMDTLYEETTKLVAVVADHAFRLLMAEALETLGTFNEALWKKWAKLFFYSARNDDDHGIELLKRTYAVASIEIQDVAKVIIEKRGHGPMFDLRPIAEIWDGDIASLLLEAAESEDLPQVALSDLLNLLLAHNADGARSFAETLIPNPVPSEDDDTDVFMRALIAGEALLRNASDCGWPILWPMIQENKEYGRKLFVRVSSNEAIIDKLSDKQASDLYVWLAQEYSIKRDVLEEDSIIGPADFRDSILRHLGERGTEASCAAIEEIAKALPLEGWLKYTIYKAKKNLLRSNWCPPDPESIHELAVNPEASLVRSPDELLEVILISLERLERKLHGVTPMSRFLWNEDRPKNENDFSDFVEVHLREDLSRRGIVANREVEFRRLSNSGVGEKTDIVVDAVSPQVDGFQTVTVVIESKGCWNKELKTAMSNQLIDRYLIDERHRHGIYLVGWFLCEKWDPSDYKKGNTPKMSLEEARELFFDQSVQYSNDSVSVSSYIMDTRLPS